MGHDHDHDHDHDHAHGHDHAHDHDHAGPALTAVIEELGPCKKLLKVEVESGEVKKEIENRFRQLRRTVHLKGFRPGKAPRKRIEKLYGEAVRDDARDHLIRQGYLKALQEQVGERKLLGEGTIENVDFSLDAGLRFEVTIHTRPEFELPDYKGVEISVPVLEVTDSELEQAVDAFRRSRGEMKEVEGEEAVVEGEDQLHVDVEVWLADEYESFAAQQGDVDAETTLKPLKTESDLPVQLPYDVLGQFPVEDLADSLAGLSIDEWGEVESELPHDYEIEEGRGEPAMLRVQVKKIQRLHLPELTEEWVKEAGHPSIEDLKRELREQMLQQKDMMRSRQIEERVLDRLVEQIGEFALPEELLEKEVDAAVRRRMLEMRIREQKSEEEARLESESERENMRGDVEATLRQFFVLDEIASREELKVTNSDIELRIARMAAQRGETPANIRAELERHDVIPQLRHELMDEKTRGFLRENATINEDEDL